MLGVGVVVLVLAALVGVAYAVDRSRGLEVAGRPVADDPAPVLAELVEAFASTTVVVRTPAGPFRSTAGELGITIDEPATLRAIEDARSGSPADWFVGLLDRRAAPLIVEAEPEAMRSIVRVKDPTKRLDAVEPAVLGSGDGIAVRRGKPGRGLDPLVVADAIEEAARSGSRPIEVDVEPGPLAPRFTLGQAEQLAEEARSLTDEPLEVQAGDVTSTVGTTTLRSWIRSTELLELDLADDEVLEALGDELEAAETPAVDATVGIVGGQPAIVPGRVGTRCCAEDAPDRVLAALLDRPASAIDLPLVRTDPDRTSDDLRALKIAEPIGSFTTRFPAGQSRVRNIHRIAEIVDGTVLGPGGRFSVNDKVGERTTEKGFVGGGAIQDGVFVESVGGGISQFATTLFNAAFFGGLDIPTYQAHSIYITRYPYGREATLSWPAPDLVISNTSPYGVLIDTSYTSTSVTVTLWSTKYATGEQTKQTEAPVGEAGCKRVRTERTRTYVDGRAKVDTVFATYRPEEGVKC